MPIKWKKKYKPDHVLQRIARGRTVVPEKSVSFSGFELHEHMPILASMLEFPLSATRLNKGSLIWSALSRPDNDLSKDGFLVAINNALSKELANKLGEYTLISSLSMKGTDVPSQIKIIDTSIQFMHKGVPIRFQDRERIIQAHHIDIPETPVGYLPVRVAVREKSPHAAAGKAIDRLDLFRGLVAVFVNFFMQSSFGSSPGRKPINRVRCGGKHTVHHPDGRIAVEAVWYEPNFKPAEIYKIKDGKKLFKAIRTYLGRIAKSPFHEELIQALVTYARAFDEPDHNTAFVKLWSSLESLVSPGVADYDKLVKRCSFMFTENEYHRQVLEHLREYRNRSVHSGMEGDDGRTNCYLLQQYFHGAMQFYIGNFSGFGSLSEANEFLDLPPDLESLVARAKTLRKAIRYVSPQGS